MKKTVVLSGSVALLLLLSVAAFADSPASLRVNVPFAFYAENGQFPAGEYVFEFKGMGPSSASTSRVLLRQVDGSASAWIPIDQGDGMVAGTNAQLVFNQYGRQYFLTKIECMNYQARLRTTKAEKELRAQGEKGTGAVLAGAK